MTNLVINDLICDSLGGIGVPLLYDATRTYTKDEHGRYLRLEGSETQWADRMEQAELIRQGLLDNPAYEESRVVAPDELLPSFTADDGMLDHALVVCGIDYMEYVLRVADGPHLGLDGLREDAARWLAAHDVSIRERPGTFMYDPEDETPYLFDLSGALEDDDVCITLSDLQEGPTKLRESVKGGENMLSWDRAFCFIADEYCCEGLTSLLVQLAGDEYLSPEVRAHLPEVARIAKESFSEDLRGPTRDLVGGDHGQDIYGVKELLSLANRTLSTRNSLDA